MKSFLSLLLFSFFSLSLVAQQDFHPSQFLAQIKSDVTFETNDYKVHIRSEKLDQLNSKYNLTYIEQLVKGKSNPILKVQRNTDGLVLFSFANSIDIPSAIHEYKATGLFKLIEPNYLGTGAGFSGLIPNDEWYDSRQWSLNNDGTFDASAKSGADISMEQAWEITTGNPSTIICILDSGLRLEHPEFENRHWNNTGENLSNNSDDDANGYINDELGWDFVNDDNDPTDDQGHGTNVTGIMAATGNNSIGYAGVDWQSKIMTGKILNSNNSGSYSDWIEAIYYSVNNGAQVINMSVGGSGNSNFMEDACDFAHDNDVVIVVCMMNTDNDTPYYPSAYASTIAVGATDTNDERVDPFFWSLTSGSNFGSHIDLCAPGNFMYGLDYSSNTNYNSYWGGTSQAAPLVAGVAALMKGIDPNLTVEEIRSKLRNSAVDQVGNSNEDVAGWDQYHGAGRLNAWLAILSVEPPVSINELQKNTFEISPNPVYPESEITIQFDGLNGEFLIDLYNNSGQRISQIKQDLIDGNLTINSPSESGIYFINISDKKQNLETIKLIVAPN